MPQLLFSLAQPRVLVLAVLCASITAYFVSLRNKTRDLLFLIGAFSCWTVHFLFSVCRESFYPLPDTFLLAEMCFGLAGLVLFVGFAYNFRGSRYPREFRIGLIAASVLVSGCLFVLLEQILANRPLNWCVGSGTSVVLFLWSEAVLIRKWIGAESPTEGRPYRDFASVFLLSVAAVGVYFLRDIGLFPADAASIVCTLLYLSTLGGFTLVYVNNALVPTTFRVKIVGATLFTILAVLTITWNVLVPSGTDFIPSPAFGNPSVSATDVQANISISDPALVRRVSIQHTVLAYDLCILGSALFVLTLFPAFFRMSLVKPLHALVKAVDRLDAGAREIELPVTFNDEIGRLTNNFNQMARSLKTAEDDIRSYAESLEFKVQQRTAELDRKNKENERLLLNILPASIAERLKQGEGVIADACPEATVLFADIVGFTDLSTRISATELVELLSGLMSDFDRLAQEHGVEKIKTIGDAYMAVAGLPDWRPDHAQAAVRLALDMVEAAGRRKTRNGKSLQLRIGINSGPVIAGVIGIHKFAYDLWGDTVNIASRMQSHSEPGRIQVTEASYKLLKDDYEFESRGKLQIKGKGAMSTYFVLDDSVVGVEVPESLLQCAVA
jgi:class 3 adenylate cyclase/HAMP domain-containing protein